MVYKVNSMNTYFLHHKKKYIIFLIFIFSSILLFSHSLYFDYFLFDDASNIYNNPHIKNISSSDLGWFWKNSLTPIPFNVWQSISFIFGTENPWPFRLLNILIHGCNGYLVYKISSVVFSFFKLSIENSFAILAGVFFLIHPISIEAIVWPSALRTCLATFFSFLFILTFLKNNLRLNFISILFFIMSILTNPIFGGVIFTLPISWIFFDRNEKVDFKEIAIDFLFLVFFIAAFFYLHSLNVTSNDFFSFFDLTTRAKLVILSFSKYISNFILPISLKFNYDINFLKTTTYSIKKMVWEFIIIFSFFALPYLAFFNSRFRFVLFCQLFLIAFLIPNLGFFLHDFNNLSVVADRYAYLALLPFSLLLTAILGEIKKKSLLFVRILGFILISGFLILNIMQAYSWKNNNHIALNDFEMLVVKGIEAEKVGQYEKAELLFLKASKIESLSTEAHGHLFHLYRLYGNKQQVKLFTESINPFDISIHSYYYLDAAEVFYSLDNLNYSLHFLTEYLKVYPSTNETKVLQAKLTVAFDEEKNYYIYRLILNDSLKTNLSLKKKLFDEMDSQSIYKSRIKSLLK
jgi:tetratricopeptide (TPR) repeat protein